MSHVAVMWYHCARHISSPIWHREKSIYPIIYYASPLRRLPELNTLKNNLSPPTFPSWSAYHSLDSWCHSYWNKTGVILGSSIIPHVTSAPIISDLFLVLLTVTVFDSLYFPVWQVPPPSLASSDPSSTQLSMLFLKCKSQRDTLMFICSGDPL